MSTLAATQLEASFGHQPSAGKAATADADTSAPLSIGWLGPMLVVAWLGYMVTAYLPL
ncbi:MAG TPA: hypothetical protein VNT30_18860 [Stellaceae bacterium]|nr:hypothetical protein [Stellaceae bacterium]